MALRGNIDSGPQTPKEPVVVKVSNPEVRRCEEPFFIRKGLESRFGRHFAQIFHDEDLGDPTGHIRKCLELERGSERQRRMIVFEPLDNITSLTDPNDVLRVWLDCLNGMV